MRVGIVAQMGNERAARLAADVLGALEELGVDAWVDEATGDAIGVEGRPVDTFDACDMVVSIGGDGTFLFAARNADTTPVLGVNLGEVGFLNAVAPEDGVEAVRAEVTRFREHGDFRTDEVTRLDARGDGWRLRPALNEVTVLGRQRGHGGGLTVDVVVDGDRYAGTHADGALVATPTGSTAYNLSEGGPLVHPEADALVVTGMAPASGVPPLVVAPDCEVTFRMSGADEALVASDGSDRRWVDLPATITVSRAAEPARVAGPGLEFFGALGKLD